MYLDREVIDDFILDKPYTQPEQKETDDEEFDEGPAEREMAEELAELVKLPGGGGACAGQGPPDRPPGHAAGAAAGHGGQGRGGGHAAVHQPQLPHGSTDQYPAMGKVEPGVYRLQEEIFHSISPPF